MTYDNLRELVARKIATTLDSSYGELIEKPITDVDYEVADALLASEDFTIFLTASVR